ncbi:hypothetical protein HN873_004766 [Arachis hypogaea]
MEMRETATLHFDSNSVIRKPAQRAGCLLKKILQVIGLRVSHQAESIKNQNNIFKAHEEKYQSRINALETLAAGATEENKICDLVAVARFLNATLIIPEIQESTCSKGISSKFNSFSYIYNV